MVEFVKSFEDRVVEERESATERVETEAHLRLTRIIDTFDNAFYTIEHNLVENGLKLDQEADDAFAVLKHKLSDLKEKA